MRVRGLVFASALATLVLAIDVLSSGAIAQLTRGVFSPISHTASYMYSKVSDSGIFSSRASLAQENATLRARLAAYEESAAGYRALKDENAALRTAAHATSQVPNVTVPVLSTFRASPYGTLVLGTGAHADIRDGDIALSDTGYVIGTVHDVGTTALLTTVFAPRASIDVLAGNIAMTLTGDGGGNAHGSVPHGTPVVVGTVVRAASFGMRPVGIIGSVSDDPASPTIRVLVRTPVNTALLRYVELVHTP
jgi:cell shape-determining protein MreC